MITLKNTNGTGLNTIISACKGRFENRIYVIHNSFSSSDYWTYDWYECCSKDQING